MFTAVVTAPGGDGIEVTPITNSVSFATQAVGGFSSCTLAVPMEQLSAARVPKLSDVKLYHGPILLWEGRVEDHDQDYVNLALGFICFGYQRLLDDNTLKRIWLQRTLPWQLVNSIGSGGAVAPRAFLTTLGRFDDTDQTRSGVRVAAQSGVTVDVDVEGNWPAMGAYAVLDEDVHTLIVDYEVHGDELSYVLRIDARSPEAADWSIIVNQSVVAGATSTAKGANHELPSGCRLIRAWARYDGTGPGTTGAEYAEVENVRLLGSSIRSFDEHDLQAGTGLGGIYASTLLRDLIAQVPGLGEGVIENDRSFVIQQLSRSQRDYARSVVEEISSYFQRKWGVWEDRKLDWRAINYDDPRWVLKLADLSACNLVSSLDNTVREVFIAYQDAATGRPGEESSESSDRRNPYVRYGHTKHEVLAAPVGMTSASAARLAEIVAADHGSIPAVRGSVKLPATTLVESLLGTAKPACHIRAGDNLVIPELPKDDYLRPGRDGQTVFHVTSSATSMEREETSLELDGYSRSTDVLMARLAAVTRVLTG